MFQNLGGAHLIVIVFIVLLLFGAPKLPGLAKSLGQSMKILKREVADSGDASGAADPEASKAAAPAPVAPRSPIESVAPAASAAPADRGERDQGGAPVEQADVR